MRTISPDNASNADSSARVKSSGRTRLTNTAPSGTSSSLRARPTKSIVSLTGISSGVVTTLRAVIAGSARRSVIHSVCERIGPTLTKSFMASGAPNCATTCPVAAASTITRSHGARPAIDSRTSQAIFPIVNTSLTPGAAVATKSKTRAIGPMRPTTGIRRLSLRYSRSEASVSIASTLTLGCTSTGTNPTGGCSNFEAISPLASTSTTRTRLPRSDARRASPAVTVLLPTPPLPVITSRRFLRSSGTGVSWAVSWPVSWPVSCAVSWA
ncbi:unannotated protein [freshwater metagenome]|uniref:Unannotated protein n=1 Tax=freshwater metagenome TaxID=449393 RepID=A0A6J7DA34_9ZZZZ